MISSVHQRAARGGFCSLLPASAVTIRIEAAAAPTTKLSVVPVFPSPWENVALSKGISSANAPSATCTGQRKTSGAAASAATSNHRPCRHHDAHEQGEKNGHGDREPAALSGAGKNVFGGCWRCHSRLSDAFSGYKCTVCGPQWPLRFLSECWLIFRRPGEVESFCCLGNQAECSENLAVRERRRIERAVRASNTHFRYLHVSGAGLRYFCQR